MSDINDSFIMYLPSDSNLELNPDNKPSNFTVQLNDTLHLDRKMEVGIVEVMVTEPEIKLYENFEFHIVWCYKTFPSNINKWDFNEHRIKTFKLSRRIYDSKQDLLNDMKKKWTDFQAEHSDHKKFYINYLKENYNLYEDFTADMNIFEFNDLKFDINLSDTSNPKLIWKTGDLTNSMIRFGETPIYLHTIILLFQFNKRLYESMKLDGNEDIMTNHVINGFIVDGLNINLDQKYFVFKYDLAEIEKPLHIDLNPELDILIICDIIEESYLNGRKLNYLLHAKCKQIDNTLIKVVNPIYFPVKRDIISSINIKVVDLLGEEIIFESGTVIYTLNFRPKEII
jgi:hypothetical protein